MTLKWDRLLQSCVYAADRWYWQHDHSSFRVVDGMQMGPDDYRAAGCMRLARTAPPEFMQQVAASSRPRPLIVARRGIAPPEPVGR